MGQSRVSEVVSWKGYRASICGGLGKILLPGGADDTEGLLVAGAVGLSPAAPVLKNITTTVDVDSSDLV